jgi:hypothetical protein
MDSITITMFTLLSYKILLHRSLRRRPNRKPPPPWIEVVRHFMLLRLQVVLPIREGKSELVLPFSLMY